MKLFLVMLYEMEAPCSEILEISLANTSDVANSTPGYTFVESNGAVM